MTSRTLIKLGRILKLEVTLYLCAKFRFSRSYRTSFILMCWMIAKMLNLPPFYHRNLVQIVQMIQVCKILSSAPKSTNLLLTYVSNNFSRPRHSFSEVWDRYQHEPFVGSESKWSTLEKPRSYEDHNGAPIDLWERRSPTHKDPGSVTRRNVRQKEDAHSKLLSLITEWNSTH